MHAHLSGITWHRSLLSICTSIRVSPQSTFMLPAMEDIQSKDYVVSKIDKRLADQLKWTPPGWKSPDTCGSLSHAPICKSYVPYCTAPVDKETETGTGTRTTEGMSKLNVDRVVAIELLAKTEKCNCNYCTVTVTVFMKLQWGWVGGLVRSNRPHWRY